MVSLLTITAPLAFPFGGFAGFVTFATPALILWLVMVLRPFGASPGPGLILAVAVALRIPMMFTSPDLSGDVWRYLWDGRVAAEGLNPYSLSPADPSLLDLRRSWHGEINHPEIRSIYPPYAQLLFLISALGGASLWIWRLILVLADVAILSILYRRAARHAFLWATFPLAVWEGIWSGHVDLVAALFLLSALISASRPFSAGLLLGVATGVKLMPVVASPSLVSRSVRPLRALEGFFLAIGIAAIPFIGRPFMGGFGAYAERWSFNGLVYSPLVAVIEILSIDRHLGRIWTALKDPLGLEPISPVIYAHLYPDFLARMALAGLLIAGLIFIVRSRRDVWESCADSLGLLLLLSPTVHPWYWLPVSLISIVAGRQLWLLLAAGSVISYLTYADVSRLVVLMLSYGLPAAGLVWIRYRRDN